MTAVAATSAPRRWRDLPPAEFAATLAGPGIVLDLGSAVTRVRSSLSGFAAQLQRLYGGYEAGLAGDIAHLHPELRAGRGLRRVWRPQCEFVVDGSRPFLPFGRDHAFPLFEWGSNWLIGQRLNHRLLLHAGSLERQGHALLMPALPGSGKSTLTAALGLTHFRMLSDEFGVVDCERALVTAMLKPVALKNASIDVIGAFAPGARIGPRFEKTRKGTVAHVAMPDDAVDRRHQAARPAMIVFPKWQADAGMRWSEVDPGQALGQLAYNAFNYRTQGRAGFDAVCTIVRASRCWQLVYSRLDEAVASVTERFDEAIAQSGPAGRAEATDA